LTRKPISDFGGSGGGGAMIWRVKVMVLMLLTPPAPLGRGIT
jgi:hypothetical protein